MDCFFVFDERNLGVSVKVARWRALIAGRTRRLVTWLITKVSGGFERHSRHQLREEGHVLLKWGYVGDSLDGLLLVIALNGR